MSCANNTFTKQPYEEFTIKADFGNNFTTGEPIDTKTVTAVDQSGADATSTVIDSSAIVGDDQVSAVVKAGTDGNVYTITFRCVTSEGHKWELDVYMVVSG